MVESRTRQPAVVVAAVAALLVVVVIGGWLLLRGDDDPAPDSTDLSPSASITDSATSNSASGATGGPESDSAEPTPTGTFSPGSLETVPVEPVRTKPPVRLDQPASFGTGLVARVTDVAAVKGEAKGPGEIAGPALRVTVQLRNTTGRSISLANSVVALSFGRDAAPAIELSGPGAKNLPGAVRAGATASGAYVFNVPVADRGRIQVSVTHRAAAPTVVFQGPAPR